MGLVLGGVGWVGWNMATTAERGVVHDLAHRVDVANLRRPNPEVFTVFRMKEQLEAVGKDRSLGLFKAFKDRRRSVKGAWETSHDLLLPHYKNRDIVSSLSARTPRSLVFAKHRCRSFSSTTVPR